MYKRVILLMGLFISLTACGTTPQERGVSGAGIGAGAGAIVGAVTGLSVVEGAVLGAVAGGLTGALTNEDQVNLGEPAWKQGNQSSTNNVVTDNKQVVMEIQKGLQDLGYNPGVVDGINGQKTRSAIRNYQQDHGLLVDGRATKELMNHIKQQS